MKKTLLILGLVMAAQASFAAEHAHWSYKGKGGPAEWGSMEADFGACKLGKEQSPIDIQTTKVQKGQLPALRPAYAPAAAELVNNGHTIQLNLTEGGSASLSGGDYQLLQFHFHTPSEEKVNGKAYPLVAHLVHKNAAGNLAVVAVLFKQGAENAALKSVFAHLPAKEGKEALADKFDASKLLPSSLGYFAFKGSLTTPPCSEGVSWHVLKNPVEISKGQLDAFRKIFPMNARPVQPLNGREVLEAQ